MNDRIHMTERCVFHGLTAVERRHEGEKKERESAIGANGREGDGTLNTGTTRRIAESGTYEVRQARLRFSRVKSGRSFSNPFSLRGENVKSKNFHR